MQRIREAEQRQASTTSTSEKESEILTAIVQRVEPKGGVCGAGPHRGRAGAQQDMIPGEECSTIGDHIKVYVLEVHRSGPVGCPGGRRCGSAASTPNLVKRLFEMEVPEIAGGVVTIKSIAREAGSRTKMAVHSTDDDD